MLAEANVPSSTNVEISYKLSCSSGKIKLVLINPNNKINIIKEVNTGNSDKFLQITVLNLEKGISKIKMVADNCYNVDLEFRQSELMVFKYTNGFPFKPLFGDDGLFGENFKKNTN